MKVARKVRDFAQAVDIHSMSYVDLNNCMGELRIILAKRLNERAKEDAQVIHDEQEAERERFDAEVRKITKGLKVHGRK